MIKLSRASDLALTALILAVTFWINWTRHYGSWGHDMSAVYYAARAYGLGEYAMIYVSQPQFFEIAGHPGGQRLQRLSALARIRFRPTFIRRSGPCFLPLWRLRWNRRPSLTSH